MKAPAPLLHPRGKRLLEGLLAKSSCSRSRKAPAGTAEKNQSGSDCASEPTVVQEMDLALTSCLTPQNLSDAFPLYRSFAHPKSNLPGMSSRALLSA